MSHGEKSAHAQIPCRPSLTGFICVCKSDCKSHLGPNTEKILLNFLATRWLQQFTYYIQVLIKGITCINQYKLEYWMWHIRSCSRITPNQNFGENSTSLDTLDERRQVLDATEVASVGQIAVLHSEKSFPNLIKSNWNKIVFTIIWLIWNQTDVRLVPNQSENGI